MNDNETAKALRAIAEWHRKQGHLGFMNFCLAGASKIEELNDFQNSQCAIVLAKLSEAERRERAAVEDMKLIVDAVREEYCDETCCFACAFDCDTSINDSGVPNCECPGFERDDCFEWRGPQEEHNAGN